MTVEEFISTAPLVSISNAELVDIIWLCNKFYDCEKGSSKKRKAFQEVKDQLNECNALVFNCASVHDLNGVGSYKILSSAHGWFKGTPYEKRAFFQICLDESNAKNPEYALLSITDYDGSKHSSMILAKYDEDTATSRPD